MSRIFVTEITDCDGCPAFGEDHHDSGIHHCFKAQRELPAETFHNPETKDFPDWCPLPKAEEEMA